MRTVVMMPVPVYRIIGSADTISIAVTVIRNIVEVIIVSGTLLVLLILLAAAG